MDSYDMSNLSLPDSSYSWSANILGQKRWNLYEPGSSEPITVIQSEGEVVFV